MLARQGVDASEIDLFEIHEAFAATVAGIRRPLQRGVVAASGAAGAGVAMMIER